jgi:nucleosome binding factor SPN SPT16 subunit
MTSDNNLLHFGSIVCMLGTRYKSYCSNVVRTMLVEPPQEVQDSYELLLKVEDDIINRLRHGVQNYFSFVFLAKQRAFGKLCKHQNTILF